MPPRASATAKGECLTEEEFAARMRLTVQAVKQWRQQGRGPDYLKGEGRMGAVRYPEAWINEWMESRRVRMNA